MTASRLTLSIYLPNLQGGGVERMKLNLCPALIERGVDVTLLLSEARGELLSLVHEGVHVVSLNAPRTLAALPGLVRHLRAKRPDVLLSSLGHNNIAALWARRLARTDTSVIICQHNALTRESAALATWQHRALPWLYRRFARDADGIVAVSRGVAEDMAAASGLPQERITVIYNPVVSPHLAVEADAGADAGASHSWFDRPGARVFLGLGRLVPQKDFATLIRAFALLEHRLGAQLVIFGEGPQRAELEALARDCGVADRVQLGGFVSNPYPYLRRSCALVMSSVYEGFGNVLVEAMACGTPVISTDCPYGPAEILDGGRFGRLVPVGDAAALARAMRATLEAPPSREVLLDRAAEFEVARVADQYVDLFRTVRGRARRAAARPPGPAPIRSVAIYIPELVGGGAQVSMTRLAHGLGRKGVDVSLLVHRARAPRVAGAPNARVIDLGVKHSLTALPGLVRYLRQQRPDVLVAAFPHNNIVAVAARWLSRAPVSVVVTEHTPVSMQLEVMRGPRYRALPWLLPLAYRRSDAVVAVSRGVRDDLAGILGTPAPRLHVIYNPVLPENWQALADEPLEHAWFADRSAPIVLSVARLSPEKNPAALVRAFARLRQRLPGVRLMMLGDGPERAALSSLIVSLGLKDCVHMAGWVDNPFPYMRRADLLVLTSNFEGFGNVLVEALACGTNVVSTDCPFGPAEILQGGAHGELVPLGEPERLSAAMEQVLSRRSAPHGSLERALEFTVERSIDRYMSLFQEIRASALHQTGAPA
jgi:glycosyltransferase involved in cell wall biosynthesis